MRFKIVARKEEDQDFVFSIIAYKREPPFDDKLNPPLESKDIAVCAAQILESEFKDLELLRNKINLCFDNLKYFIEENW